MPTEVADVTSTEIYYSILFLCEMFSSILFYQYFLRWPPVILHELYSFLLLILPPVILEELLRDMFNSILFTCSVSYSIPFHSIL